nr:MULTISPECIES: hypothetical protein [Parafrankia]
MSTAVGFTRHASTVAANSVMLCPAANREIVSTARRGRLASTSTPATNRR